MKQPAPTVAEPMDPPAGPDVLEPCAWCGLPAVLIVRGAGATLDCSSCGVRVEVDPRPASLRRTPRPGLRRAA